MPGSGRNVGYQLHPEQGDVVLELKTPLLQAADLQFLMLGALAEQVDHGIEIAMFDFQFNDAFFYIFGNLAHGSVSAMFIAILSYRTYCMG